MWLNNFEWLNEYNNVGMDLELWSLNEKLPTYIVKKNIEVRMVWLWFMLFDDVWVVVVDVFWAELSLGGVRFIGEMLPKFR